MFPFCVNVNAVGVDFIDTCRLDKCTLDQPKLDSLYPVVQKLGLCRVLYPLAQLIFYQLDLNAFTMKVQLMQGQTD